MTTPTLDDALAAFLDWEPADDAARRRLREILWRLVGDRGLAAAARAEIADAIATLDDAREFQGAKAAAGLDRIRRALDRAQLLIDGASRAEVASEVPEPPSVTIDPAALVLHVAPDVAHDLVRDFALEAREMLESAEAALLRLESSPDDAEAVNDIFRAFHTIKGTSSFLGLDAISQLAHDAEGMLDRVRSGELRFDGRVADLALGAVDALKALTESLGDVLDGASPPLPGNYKVLRRSLRHAERLPEMPAGRAFALDASPAVEQAAAPVEGHAAAQVASAESPPAHSPAPSAAPRGAPHTPDPTVAAVHRETMAADPHVRVRTEKLDRLVEMVGELVIAQGIVAQDGIVRDGTHHLLAQKVRHAEKIIRELQDLSLGLRMIPLKGAFTKLSRVVRDLAARSGKRIAFSTSGEDTEVDRTLVDLLGDPLLHMVRNAVDHGIERPADRRAAGKSETGTIRLDASQAGDRVLVRLRDDGRGLSRERIAAKAIQMGIVASVDGMSDAEVFELIFAPGFSTAEVVTDVSGRGVGMDVVRRNLSAMRGRIVIESAPGEGSTFTLELPLTLAITDGMVVRVATERFIVPTARIRRCFRPAADDVSTVQGRGELVQHGGEVIPLLRLARALRVGAPDRPATEGIAMVVGDGHDRIALLVDELLGQHQVVAKPLGETVGRVRGLTGGAILGDGRVGLILDVDELVTVSREAAAPARAVA